MFIAKSCIFPHSSNTYLWFGSAVIYVRSSNVTQMQYYLPIICDLPVGHNWSPFLSSRSFNLICKQSEHIMPNSKTILGQNFLIDKNIANKIVNVTPINNMHIIEIGPGTGFLTDEIIKKKLTINYCALLQKK